MKIKTYLIDLFSKKTKRIVTTFTLSTVNGGHVSYYQLICTTYKSGKVKFKSVLI